MARGWESKSVEAQQEERTSSRADDSLQIPDPAAAAARRTLQMARARAEADLLNARNPAHRAMLETAITALTQQLAQSGDRDT